MTATLGKLVAVSLRSVWPHEAVDFSKWLSGSEAARRDKVIGVELYITRTDGKATYHALEAQKADIQKTFGEDILDWQELPDKIASRILPQKAADPNNEADRQQQFEWLADNVERFQTAFADRIKALNVSQADVEP
jgi:hypothetical protein